MGPVVTKAQSKWCRSEVYCFLHFQITNCTPKI